MKASTATPPASSAKDVRIQAKKVRSFANENLGSGSVPSRRSLAENPLRCSRAAGSWFDCTSGPSLCFLLLLLASGGSTAASFKAMFSGPLGRFPSGVPAQGISEPVPVGCILR
jgi:hypothetical protein